MAEVGRLIYWFLKRIVVGPLLTVIYRPHVSGKEHVPKAGGAILASNHLSFSDSVFLPVVVDRPVAFLAKQEYFTGRGVKGWLTALFFKAIHQIPMDRSGGAASSMSLNAGAQVLRKGGLLGIYPEGTRSPDGKLYRGKLGVARLALQTGVPVVPVAMIGTEKVQPIGRTIPNIRRVGVVFGPALDFSDKSDQYEDRLVQREVTDKIMDSLAKLSGQEYVHEVYAAAVKLEMAREKADQRAENWVEYKERRRRRWSWLRRKR